jgi:hypothetical protein
MDAYSCRGRLIVVVRAYYRRTQMESEMDWSAITPLLIPAMTLVGGGLVGFVMHRSLDKHRTADRVPSLESENRRLDTLVTELQSQYLES